MLVLSISYDLVDLPRIPQLIIEDSFDQHCNSKHCHSQILQVRRYTRTMKLALIFNSLAGALVTSMIIVQLAINYSTAEVPDEPLSTLLKNRIWEVVLGLDVSFDVFIGLGTLFFAINLIRDLRFGKIIGGLVSLCQLFLFSVRTYTIFPIRRMFTDFLSWNIYRVMVFRGSRPDDSIFKENVIKSISRVEIKDNIFELYLYKYM